MSPSVLPPVLLGSLLFLSCLTYSAVVASKRQTVRTSNEGIVWYNRNISPPPLGMISLSMCAAVEISVSVSPYARCLF